MLNFGSSFELAGWNVWTVAALVVCTLVAANFLAILSGKCKQQRIQTLAERLTEGKPQEEASLHKTPITIVTGFLGSGKTV